MHTDGIKSLLVSYCYDGLITFSQDSDVEPTYAPIVWKYLQAQFEANMGGMEDRFILLNECILTHDNGEQMTEEESCLFLLSCAFENRTVNDRLLAYIERFVRDSDAEDHIRRLECEARGMKPEEFAGYKRGE